MKPRVTDKAAIVKRFTDAGYTLLSSYLDAKSKVKLQCPNHHEYEVVPSNFFRGKRCPDCWNQKRKDDHPFRRVTIHGQAKCEELSQQYAAIDSQLLVKHGKVIKLEVGDR